MRDVDIVPFAEESLARSGALRVALLAVDEAEPSYATFDHRRLSGFRLYA